jgi:hypothetical protein
MVSMKLAVKSFTNAGSQIQLALFYEHFATARQKFHHLKPNGY